MKTINYNELDIISYNCNEGTYSKIDKCIFNGEIYALKRFTNGKYLNGKRRKISELSSINDSHLITPKFWVKNEEGKNQYLTKFCDGDPLEFEKNTNVVAKLKHAKNLIEKMHSYKIIHGDLNISNLLFSGDEPFIIDFDNVSLNNSNVDISSLNDYSANYIKRLGINKGLDVYLFNLLTYAILNETDYYCVRSNVLAKKYGVFDFKDGIKLCNLFSLEKGYSDGDYLIDMISNEDVKNI